jgi:hypothetical protein
VRHKGKKRESPVRERFAKGIESRFLAKFEVDPDDLAEMRAV